MTGRRPTCDQAVWVGHGRTADCPEPAEYRQLDGLLVCGSHAASLAALGYELQPLDEQSLPE